MKCSVCGHDEETCGICSYPCEHLRVPNLKESMILVGKYKDKWPELGFMPVFYPPVHNNPENIKELMEFIEGNAKSC